MLDSITQLSTPPSLLKLFVRHEWTKLNISKINQEQRGVYNSYKKDLPVEDSPDDCQIELIALQSDMDTKRGYSDNSLVDFYELYACGKFPNLSRHARKIISLFGSTHCCEQFLGKMNLTKTRCRRQLTDEHLTSQLRVATTSVIADIGKLYKDSIFQVSHYNGLS